ncbi:MAG: hypothetical protein AAF585_27585, partial [Verrucomicrobiota bacterium]
MSDQRPSRWRRIPRGFRGLIWTISILALLYFGYDATGRIMWSRFKAKYEAHGVSFNYEDHWIEPAAADDFMQSPTMLGWRDDNDPALVEALTAFPEFVAGSQGYWTDGALEPLGTAIEFAPDKEGDAARGEILMSMVGRSLKPGEFEALLNFEDRNIGPPAPDQMAVAQLDAWLSPKDDAFAQLAVDVLRPECGWNREVPMIRQINNWAEISKLRIRVHLALGRSDRSLEELTTVLRFSSHLRSGRNLVAVLVQTAVLGIIIDAAWEGLHLRAWDDQQLQKLAIEIDRLKITEDFAMMAVVELSQQEWLNSHFENGTHPDAMGAKWRHLNWLLFLGHVASKPEAGEFWDHICATPYRGFEVIAPKGHYRLKLWTIGCFWADSVLGHSGDLPVGVDPDLDSS